MDTRTVYIAPASEEKDAEQALALRQRIELLAEFTHRKVVIGMDPAAGKDNPGLRIYESHGDLLTDITGEALVRAASFEDASAELKRFLELNQDMIEGGRVVKPLAFDDVITPEIARAELDKVMYAHRRLMRGLNDDAMVRGLSQEAAEQLKAQSDTGKPKNRAQRRAAAKAARKRGKGTTR